jgi:CDGSH-type Zn-finger protein
MGEARNLFQIEFRSVFSCGRQFSHTDYRPEPVSGSRATPTFNSAVDYMSDTKITCNNNGPLRISGSFVITDSKGNTFDLSGRDTISLCRCGASANMPFCDGGHARIGFKSEVEARKLPPPAPKPSL